MRSGNIWSTVLVAAVAAGVSFGVGDHESAQRDASQRVQLVQGCERSSARQAFAVALGDELARGRVERGEPRKAARAQALADASVDFIATPKDRPADERVIVGVTVDMSTTPPTARLTSEAKKLQHQGCVEAFG